eukprot:sb/3465296/
MGQGIEDIYQRATDLMTNQNGNPSLAALIRDSLLLSPIRNTAHSNMTLCLLRLSNLADLGHISSEISVRIKIDIVEQPCKVTALHHIGNYGGLGGGGFFAADGMYSLKKFKRILFNTVTKIGITSVSITTLLTFEGPLSSMGSDVTLKVAGSSKSDITLLTFVISLSSMSLHPTRKCKSFSTFLTFEWTLSSMCHHMRLKTIWANKAFPTLLTFKMPDFLKCASFYLCVGFLFWLSRLCFSANLVKPKIYGLPKLCSSCFLMCHHMRLKTIWANKAFPTLLTFVRPLSRETTISLGPVVSSVSQSSEKSSESIKISAGISPVEENRMLEYHLTIDTQLKHQIATNTQVEDAGFFEVCEFFFLFPVISGFFLPKSESKWGLSRANTTPCDERGVTTSKNPTFFE